MRRLKGLVAGALALGGLLVVQAQAQASTPSAPALLPMTAATQTGEAAACGWHRGWHGHYDGWHRNYGWHRHWGGYGWHRPYWRHHYGWHRPYGFYRPVYYGWHRPVYYGWHRPWGWHHHYGWHRW